MFLSPNHNYFILVDDGSQHEFGKEIEFRAHLESELRKGRSLKYYRNRQNNIDDSNMKNSEIPVVLIVLNGKLTVIIIRGVYKSYNNKKYFI